MRRPSIRQLVACSVVGVLLVVIGAAWLAGTHWGQRHLERLVRQRLAQHSDLVVAPFTVSISVLHNFPHVTASVLNLSLTDTSHQQAVPVLRVGRADMRLELRQIWRGQFRVSHLTLQDGEFRQFTDTLGQDWGLRGKGPRRTTPSAPPNLDLDSLLLLNVRVTDRNDLHHSGFSAHVKRGMLRVKVRQGKAQAHGKLDGQLEYLRSGRGNLFEQEPVVALVEYGYDFRRREGTFQRTKATLNGDTLLISGTHRGAAPNEKRGTHLNLRFQGTQPLLEVLHVALPTSLNRFLDGAKSPSHARIWYSIRGQSGPTTRPRTILRFELHNGQLQWADSARRIRRWDARGVFDNGPAHAPRTTSLTFEQCRVYSEAGELDASIAVRDFTKPRLQGHIQGKTELQTLAAVVAPSLWVARGGQATLRLDVDGVIPEIPDRVARRTLRPDALLPLLAARGTVQLQKAAFDVPSRQARLNDLNVRVRLHDSVWVLENLTGRLNTMRIQANATTTHLLAYFSGQRPSTRVTGTFQVDELHLHELRQLLAAPNKKPQPTAKRGRQQLSLRKAMPAARALNLLPPGLLLDIKLRCGRLILSSDTLLQLAATVRHNGELVQLGSLQARVWDGQLTGAASWPTDTLNPQPVAARFTVHFPTLSYERMLARITQPSRRPAKSPADPTLREVLLTANGQANVTIGRLLLPGKDYLTNLRLRMDKKAEGFVIPALSFGTRSGGKGQVSASAQFQGTRLAKARADMDLRYTTLDVQHLLQLLASLSTIPAPDTNNTRRSLREANRTSPFLDGTFTGRVRVSADQMHYGALRGSQFKLRSSLEAGKALVEECAMQALGGSLQLRGTLRTDAGSLHHPLHAQIQLQDIQLPELFSLAKVLGLDVLGPENIRGRMRCETDVHTDLDHTFLPRLAQTKAFLRTDLRGLELIEVDALMQAISVLSEKRTGHVYFEPVRPRFVLDGGRVLIPGMSLSSNLTDMDVSGEYHLDGHANLYVGLSPMQAFLGDNKKRIERIQSGEATQRASRGLVYINLRRTPGSRYKVRLFQKQEQQAQQTLLQKEYRQLLLQQPLDTTLRLLQ